MVAIEQLVKLAGEHDEQIYASGEQIIRQGDPGESMFFTIDGEVVVTLNVPGKEQIQLRRLESGDYFGEMSLMTGEPRLATVTATAETRVFEVTRSSFREILEQQPSLLKQIGDNIHRRLIEKEEAVEGARSQHRGETSSDILTTIKEFFRL